LLSVSLPPCCRYHPAGVGQPFQPVFGCPCCLRPQDAGSASGAPHFRGHLCVYFRYGLVTRCHPSDDFVDRLQSFGFPPPCYPSYGASGSYPGRTVFLLNTPALAGHTTQRAVFPHWAFTKVRYLRRASEGISETRLTNPISPARSEVGIIE